MQIVYVTCIYSIVRNIPGLLLRHWWVTRTRDNSLILVGDGAANHHRQWMHFRQQGTWSWHCRRGDARRRTDNGDRQVNTLVGRARLSLCITIVLDHIVSLMTSLSSLLASLQIDKQSEGSASWEDCECENTSELRFRNFHMRFVLFFAKQSRNKLGKIAHLRSSWCLIFKWASENTL